jgi:hypothetical protein
MRKFRTWFMTAVMLSLPAVLFGQATGGSTDSKIKEGSGSKGAGTGRKGLEKTHARKGRKTTTKQTGSKSTDPVVKK